MGNYASVRIYICSYGQFGGEELVLPWRLWRYGPLTMMLHSHPSRGNYPRGTWHDALAARGARAAWRREGGGGAEGVPKCYKLGTVAGFSRCVTTLSHPPAACGPLRECSEGAGVRMGNYASVRI